MNKDIVIYVDMDNVVVDFQSGLDQMDDDTLKTYTDREDEIPGIFSLMKPMPDAVSSYVWLAEHFDTYILSTAPWENNTAWSDKHLWVQKYLGEAAHKRLILSHHKNLVFGDYIIDDRTARGVDRFKGTHLHFGKGHAYETWNDVVAYFREKYF